MSQPGDGYLLARRRVIGAGYESDITWAKELAKVEPNEFYVMSETAWVICCSGFRVSVVRKMWPALRSAFFDWWPEKIAAHPEACIAAARAVYNHERKLKAITEVAAILVDGGFEPLVNAASFPTLLTRLPYIGKVTCYHLAKLLGADVVKPDVHLVRAAAAAGFPSPYALCKSIASDARCDSRLTVIDSVLWRYGERLGHGENWPSWEWVFA